jgi:hypothetical protein
LSRIRMRPRTPGAMQPMRCSLGYALATDDDVARCRAVDGPSACWKAGTPSWRVPARLEEPEELAAPHANGHIDPVAGETEAMLGEDGSLVIDEVIEIDVISVQIFGEDA